MGLSGGARYEKLLAFEEEVEDVVLDVDAELLDDFFPPPPPLLDPPLFPPCSKLSWSAPVDFSEGDAVLRLVWKRAPCYCRSGENKEHVPAGGGLGGSPDVAIGLGLGCFGTFRTSTFPPPCPSSSCLDPCPIASSATRTTANMSALHRSIVHYSSNRFLGSFRANRLLESSRP